MDSSTNEIQAVYGSSTQQDFEDNDGEELQVTIQTVPCSLEFKPRGSYFGLPLIPVRNPYYNFIINQNRLSKKYDSTEQDQLEKLEKDTEEEIRQIAENFCRQVKIWDEVDSTVAEFLKSSNQGDMGAAQMQESSPVEVDSSKMEDSHHMEFNHLSDPEWVTNLFRVDFGSPWSQGFARQMRESSPKASTCSNLGLSEKEQRKQKAEKSKSGMEKLLSKEADRPKVAFGTTVKRAKGLDDYSTRKLKMIKEKNKVAIPKDLVTMETVWKDILNTYATKIYCKHLRGLIRTKIEGKDENDPSLSSVSLCQMKPKVLLDAGLLDLKEDEEELLPCSLSSTPSSSLSSLNVGLEIKSDKET